jgi:phosphatidylserine/phosphatidylglycerophosphate/cardiolipin synthase-like enzyme
VNTQRMLESLGRGDTIPAITKLRRIEQAKAQSAAVAPSLGELLEQRALSALTSLIDGRGGDISSKAKEAERETSDNNRRRLAQLEKQIEEINKSELKGATPYGLKVHICSLVAPDSPAGKDWMPVYIHSKLMIIDDVFTTHGSANINTRSMQVDSEMNIAHEWASVTEALRRRLWDRHTKGKGAQDDPAEAFKAWQEIIDENRGLQKNNKAPSAPLVEFYYGEATLQDLD